MRFELQDAYCGLHVTQLCVKTRRIATTPFAFVMPQ